MSILFKIFVLILVLILVLWIVKRDKSVKHVRWRDECTSKELTNITIIPNREEIHKYEDLPEYTSSQYLPNVDKLINQPENSVNELTMLIEPPAKELFEHKPRRML